MKKIAIFMLLFVALLASCENVTDDELSSAKSSDISRSIFNDRCVINGPYSCKDFSLNESTVTIFIENNDPSGIFAMGARVYYLGPGSDDRIEMSCDFDNLNIKGFQDFDLACELDEEILKSLNRNSFRLEIDALEQSDLTEKKIVADIYVR